MCGQTPPQLDKNVVSFHGATPTGHSKGRFPLHLCLVGVVQVERYKLRDRSREFEAKKNAVTMKISMQIRTAVENVYKKKGGRVTSSSGRGIIIRTRYRAPKYNQAL